MENSTQAAVSGAEYATASTQQDVGSKVTTKTRKPYVITKQRERWAPDEHEKFLEALKLFGRQWRKIEEYIGTKTAVQIRSHAQKFFTKVERERQESKQNGRSATCPLINIPPPRPKRKPSHPYPKKAKPRDEKCTSADNQAKSSHGEVSGDALKSLGSIELGVTANAAALSAALYEQCLMQMPPELVACFLSAQLTANANGLALGGCARPTPHKVTPETLRTAQMANICIQQGSNSNGSNQSTGSDGCDLQTASVHNNLTSALGFQSAFASPKKAVASHNGFYNIKTKRSNMSGSPDISMFETGSDGSDSGTGTATRMAPKSPSPKEQSLQKYSGTNGDSGTNGSNGNSTADDTDQCNQASPNGDSREQQSSGSDNNHQAESHRFLSTQERKQVGPVRTVGFVPYRKN